MPLDGSLWPSDLWDLADVVTAPTLYSAGPSLTAWATTALSQIDDDDLFVIGNSVGGSCALEVARLAHERIRGVVLIGAKAGSRPEPAVREEAILLLRREGVDAAWARYWAPLFAPGTDPLVLDRGLAMARNLTVAQQVNGVSAFHTRPDRTAFLAELDIPVTIVRGEHDRVPKDAARLASTLRRGSFVEVPGSGHYVPLEQPDRLLDIAGEAIDAVR